MSNSVKLDRYNPESDDIRVYLDMFELICEALPDTSTDAKKKSVLIASLGIDNHSKLMQKLSPKKTTEVSLEEMKTALIDLYYTPPSLVYAFYVFFTRVKKKNETVKQFHIDVKRLADNCGFPIEFYDLMVKALLFVGCKEEEYFKQISNNDFDFLKIKSHEMCQKLVILESLYANNKVESTNVVHTKKKCTHCGKSNHDANVCYFKDANCYRCKKSGHIATSCKSKKFVKKNDDSANHKKHQKSYNSKKKTSNKVDDQDESASSSDSEHMNRVTVNKISGFVDFEIDVSHPT